MNQLVQNVLGLEEELKKLSKTSEVKAIITSESRGEMMDAANYLNSPMIAPFQAFENDYYYFTYHPEGLPHISIEVKSKQQYKKREQIVELT